VALAIGFVIGAERGFENRNAAQGTRTAGVRTFALVGLLGGVAVLLSERFGGAVLGIGGAGVAALALASYLRSTRPEGDLGITTEVALLLAYAVSALAGTGLTLEAVATAIVIAAVLGFKRELHRGLAWFERREFVATLQILLIAAVAIPLLPDRDLGPYAALNPRRIGLLVLLLAGISYVGWFAVRILGSRAGLVATAALGGLSSSTAVTLAYARFARAAQSPLPLFATGILAACGVMALRLFALVSFAEPRLAAPLAPPLFALCLIPWLAAWRGAAAPTPREDPGPHALPLRNPLALESALVAALMLALLSLLVRAGEQSFGERGVYAVAALSGIADADAVSLSVAQAAGANLALETAAWAVALAACVNTAAKAFLAAAIGGRALARRCLPPLVLALLAAIATASLWIPFSPR